MDIVKPSKWASAIRNPEFYLVETWSGYRSSRHDPDGARHALPPTVAPNELGAALFDALEFSRFLFPNENPEFFDLRNAKKKYADWIEKLMVQYGYKNKRMLLRNMEKCEIFLTIGEKNMRIRPMRHETLEGWVGTQNEGVEDVIIPVDSSPEVLGNGLLLAFSRCT